MLEFRVLGPLEVRRDGQPIALPGLTSRRVLAALALRAGDWVSVDRLIDELWGERPPASARKALQMHVSRLRAAMAVGEPGAARMLERGTDSYRLEVPRDAVDAVRFEDLLADAQAADDPSAARAKLEQALALWRGAPLAELELGGALAGELQRLQELRLVALELRIEQQLRLGSDVVGELRQLVAEHPFRERLRGQLMLALYRAGRQADALRAFQDARRLLVDELGLEPGLELQELQQAILAHDATLRPTRDEREGKQGAVRTRSRLPHPPNRTVGRSRELRQVAELLRAEHARLVTLIGPGGVGKTRLALESAHAAEGSFADGAYFVSLAATERADDVPATVAAALELTPLAGESPAKAVERHVTARQILLVIDNLEHVLDAARHVGALLAAAPGMTVLATSREPLNLAAEQRLPVKPLALPPRGSDEHPRVLGDVPAVALFTERARAHAPNFALTHGNAPAVAELCRRLDGLPLAIELAAARCELFSPGEILARLDASFATLGGGARDAPARQRSLRATLDWSHELLNEREQIGLARFAVFAGGATVDAAETVTGVALETLAGLVTKSLLVRSATADEPTRLGMLETVRAYAGERLAAALDCECVHHRHFEHGLDLLRRHGTEQALFGADSKRHMAILDADAENLHSALRWAIDRGACRDAMTMMAALARYWRSRARDADIVACSQAALALASDDIDPTIRITVLLAAARSLRWLGRLREQPPLLAEAEMLARELADPLVLAHTLRMRADQEAMSQRTQACERYADEALQWAEAAGSRWEYASAAYNKAIVAGTLAELDRRVAWAAGLLDESGNPSRLARLWTAASHVALGRGDAQAALRFAQRAIPITTMLADSYDWAIVQLALGYAAVLAGDTDRAHRALRDYFTLTRELRTRPDAEAFMALAGVAASRGEDRSAARLAGVAQTDELALDAVLAEAVHTRFLRTARRRCGEQSWRAAAREGAGLTLVEGVGEALAFLDHTPSRAHQTSANSPIATSDQ